MRFWLKLTQRAVLLCLSVFAVLLALSVHVVIGDSAIARFICDNEGVSAFLLGVMQISAYLLPIAMVAHGAVALYALLRS